MPRRYIVPSPISLSFTSFVLFNSVTHTILEEEEEEEEKKEGILFASVRPMREYTRTICIIFWHSNTLFDCDFNELFISLDIKLTYFSMYKRSYFFSHLV